MAVQNNQDKELKVKLTADTTELKRAFESVGRQLKTVTGDINRTLDSTMKQATNSFTELPKQTLKEYQKLPTQLRRTFDEMEREMRSVFDVLPKEAKKSADAVKKETQQMGADLKKPFNGVGNEIGKEVEKIPQKIKKEMAGASAEVGREFDKMGEQARPGLNKLEKEAEKSAKQMKASFSNVTSSLQSVGRDMSLFVTAPVAGAGIAAVKKYSDFDQILANIKSLGGITEEQMQKVEDLSIKLGADTKYSAKEAAEGFFELQKSGVSVEDALNGGLAGALTLATAGELELKDAAEIASTALNAFKDDNLSVSKAADILAGAASSSATDVGELKFGLAQVSAVASGVGLSFEDTATALAAFSNNGLKGSDAGTSLKTMLMNLIPKTKEQVAEFDRLGLLTFDTDKALQMLADNGMKVTGRTAEDAKQGLKVLAAQLSETKLGSVKAEKAYSDLVWQAGVMGSAFYDAHGNIKSFEDIAGTLQRSLKGMTSAQRSMALETIFGSDAVRAGNIAYKEGAEGIAKMNGEMSKTTASQVAEQRMKTLKGAIEEMRGAIETILIQIGSELAPTIKRAAGFIQGMADSFGKLTNEQKDFVLKIAGITAAIGPLLIALTGAVFMFQTLAPLFVAITAASSPLLIALGALATALVLIAGKEIGNPFTIFGQGADEAQQKMDEVQTKWTELNDNFDKNVIKLKLKMETDENIDKEIANLQQAVDNKSGFITQEIETNVKEGKSNIKGMKGDKDLYKNNKSVIDTAIEAQEAINGRLENDKKLVATHTKEINTLLQDALTANNDVRKKKLDEAVAIWDAMNNIGEKSIEELQYGAQASLDMAKGEGGEKAKQYVANAIKLAEEKRVKTVEEAEKEYRGTVEKALQARDEQKSITQEQYEALVEAARLARDKRVRVAENEKNAVVAKANEMYENLNTVIETENGKLKPISFKMEFQKDSLQNMINVGRTFETLFAKLPGGKSPEEVTKQYDELQKNLNKAYADPQLKLKNTTSKLNGPVRSDYQPKIYNNIYLDGDASAVIKKATSENQKQNVKVFKKNNSGALGALLT